MPVAGALKKPLFVLYLYLQTVLLAFFTWHLCHSYYEDDAYISLRYARDLLDGAGMTWNPGERIEGYTNFLFILLEAGLGKLGMNLVLASLVISFAAFIGLLIVLWRYLSRQPGTLHAPANRALAICLVGSSVPLLAWCWGGLESVLFAFFCTVSVCDTLLWLKGKGSAKAAFGIGIWLALATLTRPEGLLFLGVTGLFLLLKRERFSWLCWMTAAFAIVFIPYMAWRAWYFGELLPNTYYAKAWGIAPAILWSHGATYLLRCLLLPPWLILFAAGLFISAARARAVTAPILYLALLAAAFLFYIAGSGGDFMPYVRFLVPVIPLLALLAYHCLERLERYSARRWHDLVFLLTACMLAQPAAVGRYDMLSPGAISGLAVADYVKSHWPKGSVIALNPAGALPYTAPDYYYIDMLGLLDKHIARRRIGRQNIIAPGQRFPGHTKGDGAYVMSRKPDYIIFRMCWGDDKSEFLSETEMGGNPSFKALYQKVTVWVTPPAGLLPQLKVMAGLYSQDPVLNNKNQLRFIYWKRKK